MVRTRVGYAGGTSTNPTYHNLDGHSETIQIDYDPSKINYKDLLNVFWSSHYPDMPAYSRQYMSIIFFHNEAQHEMALASKQEEAKKLGKEIVTEIIPFSAFYLAEDYHQKYYLQQESGLMTEFYAMYPDTRNFIDSTAAARINGYAGGNGSIEILQKELPVYGLTEKGNNKLLEIAQSGSGVCPVQ